MFEIDLDKEDINWNKVSQREILSEDMIEKYQAFVNWANVSKYQTLSEAFIIKHKNEVNWKYISSNQKLSEGFINKYKDYLDMELVKDNWLNKSEEFKRNIVRKTGLYECYDDYFIAYTLFFEDAYVGMVIERFADGSSDEYGVGLSVMPKEDADFISKKAIIKCKVYYNDVARILYDCINGEVRCSKYEVIEIIDKERM